jgi:heme-degrading monooxygenase HmoA
MWLNGKPPEKDYYAVIFSSTKEDDLTGYYEMDNRLMELAQQQPGFLGYENAAGGNKSVFISYWETMEAIDGWRKHSTHLIAKGQVNKWYKRYLSQICKVEYSRLFEK